MSYFKNTEIYLELTALDNHGGFISGLSVPYYIYKSSDNTLFASGTMTEIGTSGVYKAPVTFTSIGQYRVEYITPHKYENAIDSIFVEDTNEQIERILGLSQENYRIFSPTYDARSNLLSGTVKIYPTAADVDADTNAIATYSITATYNAQNQMNSYKVKKT